MKKIMLMVVAAMMTTVSVNAQSGKETKHEIAVAYGGGSVSEWVDAFGYVGVAITGGKIENSKYSGPIALEYFYHLNKTISVGAIGVYGQKTEDIVYGNNDPNPIKYKNRYATVMPAVKFEWLKNDYLALYSKAAVGATLHTTSYDGDSDSMVHLNFQASLVGFEAGSKNIRAFAELGWGEQGLLLGGVRVKF